jgi:hypothetical protein
MIELFLSGQQVPNLGLTSYLGFTKIQNYRSKRVSVNPEG